MGSMNRSVVVSIIISVAGFAGLFFGLQNAQNISDWWFLRTYMPSSEIAALADSSFLNETGRDLFYVSDPEVNSAEVFNENCPFKERSFVLGCYYSDRIYIFDVEDPRLDGIKEVTAAHEMLHAAYSRLDNGTKDELEVLLDAELAKLNNQRLLDLVQSYREADESSIHNEMHSIFGTELTEVSAELEAHYAQYFSDRAGIVAIAEDYEAVFEELQQEANTLLEDIEGSKILIESLERQLNDKQAVIESIENQLDTFKQNIDTARANGNASAEVIAVDQFNALLPQLRSVITDHNNLVETFNETVEQTNRDVETYNSIVVEQTELIDSINSKKQTIEEQ